MTPMFRFLGSALTTYIDVVRYQFVVKLLGNFVRCVYRPKVYETKSFFFVNNNDNNNNNNNNNKNLLKKEVEK